MKYTLLTITLLLASLLTEARKVTLVPNQGAGYATNNPNSFLPGDTVLILNSKTMSYISLTNQHGTSLQPIVFMNSGGQVQMIDGFAIENCTYVKVLGIGAKDNFGFHIQDPNSNGTAITIFGRSAGIEVSNIDIYHKTYGFWVKEEQTCYDSLNAITPTNPNGWTINHISIHDNRIIKTNQEGMYLGSTDPNGARGVRCSIKINGKDTMVTQYPIAERLSDIQVYNNWIDSTNRSGIQLSGGTGTGNRIYNNHVTHCGFEDNTAQGAGIWFGGFTNGKIDHNFISSTFLSGIFLLGAGWQYVDSNTIDSSGMLGSLRANGMAGIAADTRRTGNPVDSAYVSIVGNIIHRNTDTTIHVMDTYCCYCKGNVICGNYGVNPANFNIIPTLPKIDATNVTLDKNNV